jgi:hypothetical protein
VGFADFPESRTEILEMIQIFQSQAKVGKGFLTIEDMPTDYGQIHLIAFGMEAHPQLWAEPNRIFHETVKKFHNQASLEAFAQDGNPDHLPHVELDDGRSVPILIHLDEVSKK